MTLYWPKEFEIYLNELLEWNKKFNLTSIIDKEDAKYRHFFDSLTLNKAFDFSLGAPSVIDIGSGAGFPGVPLKIAFPNLRMVLLDSTAKKVGFLEHIISLLGLKDIRSVWARAEDHARERTDSFDVALCRALAPLNTAAELCLPFVRVGGRFLAMKGKEADKEILSGSDAIKKLGGSIEEVVDTPIIDAKGDVLSRKIVVIAKISKTPPGYPRKAGLAKKRPL